VLATCKCPAIAVGVTDEWKESIIGWATVEIIREEQEFLAEKRVLFSCTPTTIVEEEATLENIPFKLVCSLPLKEITMAIIDIKITIPASIFIFLI